MSMRFMREFSSIRSAGGMATGARASAVEPRFRWRATFSIFLRWRFFARLLRCWRQFFWRLVGALPSLRPRAVALVWTWRQRNGSVHNRSAYNNTKADQRVARKTHEYRGHKHCRGESTPRAPHAREVSAQRQLSELGAATTPRDVAVTTLATHDRSERVAADTVRWCFPNMATEQLVPARRVQVPELANIAVRKYTIGSGCAADLAADIPWGVGYDFSMAYRPGPGSEWKRRLLLVAGVSGVSWWLFNTWKVQQAMARHVEEARRCAAAEAAEQDDVGHEHGRPGKQQLHDGKHSGGGELPTTARSDILSPDTFHQQLDTALRNVPAEETVSPLDR